MPVLRDSHIQALCLRLLSTLIHLLQSVAFFMNSCQQFEGYGTEYTGQVTRNPSRSSEWV